MSAVHTLPARLGPNSSAVLVQCRGWRFVDAYCYRHRGNCGLGALSDAWSTAPASPVTSVQPRSGPASMT